MQKKMLLAVVALALTSGCYSVKVTTTSMPRAGFPSSHTSFHVLNGLTNATVPAVDCPNGIAQVEYSIPWWSPPLSLITAGLLGATTTNYVCAAEPSASAR